MFTCEELLQKDHGWVRFIEEEGEREEEYWDWVERHEDDDAAD